MVMIPFCLWMRTLLFSNAFGNFILAEYAKKHLPLGTKSAENPQFGNHKHCSMKTLRIREENPVVWYSNNVHQPVITPNALSVNKIASWVPCKSTLILFHHSTSSPLAPEEKTPRPWRTRESNPSRRAARHQRNTPSESEFYVNSFLALVCDPMVYPSLLFQS
jgi:hypothetical protein